MRYKLPDWCLLNIYFAFVHPYILYGLGVYGNTFLSYLDKLTVGCLIISFLLSYIKGRTRCKSISV